MAFADRSEAGRKLAETLLRRELPDPVVIALPRGGLPVAAEIASALHAPLDIALVRKVGAPGQPELALAAVSDGAAMEVTVNDDVARIFGLSEAEIEALARRELPELERRRRLYCGDRAPLTVGGKAVILVDDGVATGATMRSALRILRKRGAKKVVIALPVAPAETLAELAREADETICLETPHRFQAVGAHYGDFRQVSDAEVTRILGQAQKPDSAPGEGSPLSAKQP